MGLRFPSTLTRAAFLLAAALLAVGALPRHAMAQNLPVVTMVLTSTGTTPHPGTKNPSENGGVVTVTATMDKVAQGVVSLTFAAEPSARARPDNYRMSANTVLTFAAGDTVSTGLVQIFATDNDADEPSPKRIRVTGTVTSGNALIRRSSGLSPTNPVSNYFQIVDDEHAPTATVHLSSKQISEDGGATEITVTLSHPTWRGDMFLDAQLGFYPEGTPNRALQEDVSLSQNRRLVVPEGELSSPDTVTVTAVDNDAFEGEYKIFGVRLHNVNRATVPMEPGLETPWQIVRILEDDPVPLRFSESNYDVTEGEAAEVVLVLEPALPVPVDFAVEVRPGTAVAEDLDANWRAYWRFGERRFSRGFRIPAGQTQITVPVLTARDTLSENAETLTVHVLRATIKDGSDTDLPPTSPATVTIRDVPPATPVVSFAEAVSFAGENAGTRNIRVNLRPAPSSAINVVYVLGGTATGGVDYTIANAGSVGVPSGATSVTIPVVIVNDSEDEGAETVLLTLNAGDGYSVHATRNEHILIITGDGGGRGGGMSPNRLPTVTATCNPCVVEPGGEVGLTAVASDADGDTLTHSWSAPGGRFAGPSDAATTRWIAPDERGRPGAAFRPGYGGGAGPRWRCADVRDWFG